MIERKEKLARAQSQNAAKYEKTKNKQNQQTPVVQGNQTQRTGSPDRFNYRH